MIKQAVAWAMVKARRHPDTSVEALESLHLEPDIPRFNDSLYLYGRGTDGTAIVTRLAVRTGAPAEVWMNILLPGQPEAFMADMHHPHAGGMAAGGLRWEVVVPGKQWRVSYAGPLQQGGSTVQAQVELTFDATGPIVDFSDGIKPSTTAKALAAEPWSRSFFEQLGEIRTTHYEQAGRITGTVTLDGTTHEIDLLSLRDHSFGRRKWSSWDRHIWFSGLCEDGTTFTVAQIRYDFVGPLIAGFVMNQDRQPIAACSPFDAIGARGDIPSSFSMTITTAAGTTHALRIETDHVFRWDVDGGDYCLREAAATFTLDGVPGVGIAEFGWNPHG